MSHIQMIFFYYNWIKLEINYQKIMRKNKKETQVSEIQDHSLDSLRIRKEWWEIKNILI